MTSFLIGFAFFVLLAVAVDVIRKQPRFQIPKAKFVGDLIDLAEPSWGPKESDLARKWLLMNEPLTRSMSVTDWSKIYHAAYPRSSLRHMAEIKRAKAFAYEIANSSPLDVILASSKYAPLDTEMVYTALARLAVLREEGKATRPWHWGMLWQLSFDMNTSPAYGYWHFLSEGYLRGGDTKELIQFIDEAVVNQVPLCAEWEGIFLRKLWPEKLSADELALVELCAEENDYHRLLESIRVFKIATRSLSI